MRLQKQQISKPPIKNESNKPKYNPDHIVGQKNSFVEIQKRKYFQNIDESQDIYFGRRKSDAGSQLFAPQDKKDEMIAHQAELLPPCKFDEKNKGIGRNGLTEEALDDWIAQSLTRTIPEMLDPKKKFQIPYKYLDELKERYPHLIPQVEAPCEDEEEQFLRGLLEDDSIVDRKTLEQKKKQFRRRKNKNNSDSFFLQKTTKDKNVDLKIDSKKLDPKALNGTFIKPPTTKSLLNNQQPDDVIRIQNYQTSPPSMQNILQNQNSAYNPRISTAQPRKRYNTNNTNNTQTDESIDMNDLQADKMYNRPVSHEGSRYQPAHKLFTLNISNFLRKNNNDKDIETSIAEKEIKYIEGVMNQQNERKQLEELTREQKKLSLDHFKDLQKQNRKELNRIVNDAMTYCQNPSDLQQSFQQPLLTNNSQITTKDKRPQSHSSNRGQSRGQEKRFFILTKLQSKPNTAQSGQRTRLNNSVNPINQNQQDKYDGFQQTKQSFYIKTQNQNTEEQQYDQKQQNSQKKLQNFFDQFQSSDYIKIQNDSPLKNSFYPSYNQDIKQNINEISNGGMNNKQMTNSSFYYSSLKTYQQSRMNEIKQRITLKELTRDYINQDQNKATTIFKISDLNQSFQNQSRVKSQSYHINNSFNSQVNNSFVNYDKRDNKQNKTNQTINLKKGEQNSNLNITNYSTTKQDKKGNELPEKVDKLLNSGSEDNLIKPNDDFANLVLHLEEMKITEKKQENMMSNAEFWFYKSWKLIEKGQTEVATQCLKQVLIQDKLHYKSIFNMGSLYEKTKKFNTALDWLKISKEFDENQEQTIYGISLCLYKIKNFQQSYENINKLIEDIKIKDDPPSKYIYLRSLCLKQLGRIQEAEEDYKIFYKKTSPKNFDLLMHFMILFSFKYKNKIAKYQDLEIKYSSRTYCNFHSAVQQIIQGEYFEMKLGNYYHKKNGWNNIESIIPLLQSLSFFKRFASPLLKKCLPYLEHNLIEKEKLINPCSDEIYIIIAGNVQVFDHSKNYEKPDIVSYYTEGDIIGCDNLENNLSTKPNVWLISQTPVEYLKMQKNLFLDLWKAQYSLEGEKITSLLRNCPLLQGISEISMLKLSYELVSLEEYKVNDIIYNDGTFLESMNFSYIEMKKCSIRRGAGIVKRIIQKMTSFNNLSYRMTKLRKLYLKHKQKIKQLMWSSKIIKGFYIIVEGIVQLENDIGWNYLLTPGDFFGENLIFKVKGLSNFGRMRAISNSVKVLFLPRDKFNQINSLDKAVMKKNCLKREQIENVEYLSKRYSQIRSLKLKRKKDEEEALLKNQTDEDFIQQL